MRDPVSTRAPRAERRAAIDQRPMAFGRHSQSAGTGYVRPHLAKPARIPRATKGPVEGRGDRPMYPSDEGQS